VRVGASQELTHPTVLAVYVHVEGAVEMSDLTLLVVRERKPRFARRAHTFLHPSHVAEILVEESTKVTEFGGVGEGLIEA
jgi:hypothetical protein